MSTQTENQLQSTFDGDTMSTIRLWTKPMLRGFNPSLISLMSCRDNKSPHMPKVFGDGDSSRIQTYTAFIV